MTAVQARQATATPCLRALTLRTETPITNAAIGKINAKLVDSGPVVVYVVKVVTVATMTEGFPTMWTLAPGH